MTKQSGHVISPAFCSTEKANRPFQSASPCCSLRLKESASSLDLRPDPSARGWLALPALHWLPGPLSRASRRWDRPRPPIPQGPTRAQISGGTGLLAEEHGVTEWRPLGFKHPFQSSKPYLQHGWIPSNQHTQDWDLNASTPWQRSRDIVSFTAKFHFFLK